MKRYPEMGPLRKNNIYVWRKGQKYIFMRIPTISDATPFVVYIEANGKKVACMGVGSK